MKLAALPEHSAEACGDGGFEAGVVVTDDGLEAIESAILQAFEELAPMDFGFGEFAGNTEDRAFALVVDADGDEHGAASDRAIV